MPTAPLYTDDLLDPISADQPAGTDQRWTAEWDRIKEARRADDGLDSGKWVKKERKSSDWPAVKSLTTTMLRERSKDLQLALWLTEADIKLHGFAGLRDGLQITRELMVRYWDKGLFPAIEDGPDDRAGPFEWLNNKLVDSITAIPLTARTDAGRDYSFLDLEDARRVGSEANFTSSDGEIDVKKKRDYEEALADGHVSKEMFYLALDETPRATLEELTADFQQAHAQFRALEKTVDEYFGESAPILSACRSTLLSIGEAFDELLARKRKQEPDGSPIAKPAPSGDRGGPAEPVVMRFPLSLPQMPASGALTGSWQDAEALVRSGEVERGLAEMARLAAAETTGRSRFQRKLLLAEVCLASKRERLARQILDELAEQIDSFHLESWESSELVAAVWTRLYRLLNEDGGDRDRAAKLYERLCRLDPWQALGCGEG